MCHSSSYIESFLYNLFKFSIQMSFLVHFNQDASEFSSSKKCLLVVVAAFSLFFSSKINREPDGNVMSEAWSKCPAFFIGAEPNPGLGCCQAMLNWSIGKASLANGNVFECSCEYNF